jgi:23S rRNA (adenine2503-C2)-methyltransferase
VEHTFPTEDLMAALREYHAATGQRVILAWIMIAGVNTREEDARQLAALTAGLPIKLDLIDVNDASGRFKPPSADELASFRDALRRHLPAPVARRYSGGRDIDAACGMLAAQAGQ